MKWAVAMTLCDLSKSGMRGYGDGSVGQGAFA